MKTLVLSVMVPKILGEIVLKQILSVRQSRIATDKTPQESNGSIGKHLTVQPPHREPDATFLFFKHSMEY